MIAKLFAPRLPADEWAEERDRIARRKPSLALVAEDPRPDPDHVHVEGPGHALGAQAMILRQALFIAATAVLSGVGAAILFTILGG